MAWWYYASLRVQNQFQAEHLSLKYHGQPFTFNRGDGAIGCVPARIVASHNQRLDNGEHWATIGCYDITDSGICDEDEARKANEFDNILYGMLRNEKWFDFGMLTVEPGEFRSADELVGEFRDGSVEKLHGIMVSTAFLEEHKLENELKNFKCFEQFSGTHLWIPKRPEKPAGLYDKAPGPASYCGLCRNYEITKHGKLTDDFHQHTDAVKQAGCKHPAFNDFSKK